jgi:hypothetical protein
MPFARTTALAGSLMPGTATQVPPEVSTFQTHQSPIRRRSHHALGENRMVRALELGIQCARSVDSGISRRELDFAALLSFRFS